MINSVVRLPKARELLLVYSELFENTAKQTQADLAPSAVGVRA